MEISAGMIIEGKVTGITTFGMFMEFEGNKKGLVHISEISDRYIKEIADLYKVNDVVKVKVLSVEPLSGKISLSVKQAQNTLRREQTQKEEKSEAGEKKRNFSSANTNTPRREHTPRKEHKEPDEYGGYEYAGSAKNTPAGFEEMMEKYKKQSSEKISDMKKFMDSRHGGGYSKRGGGKPK